MTEISRTTVHSRTACSKATTSKRVAVGSGLSETVPLWLPTADFRLPIAVRNWSRLSEARLQAVSSRNMYSEHGLEARIAPDALQVCQSFMVVLKCRPGSGAGQAAG